MVVQANAPAARRGDECAPQRPVTRRIGDETRLIVTKRRKAGAGGELCQLATKAAAAVQSAIRALRRNPLAARGAAAYSANQRQTTTPQDEPNRRSPP
jgi:hypothetical protein